MIYLVYIKGTSTSCGSFITSSKSLSSGGNILKLTVTAVIVTLTILVRGVELNYIIKIGFFFFFIYLRDIYEM